MWQVGLRYEGIDLDDGTVLGGEENNLTLGVNWYWHTNFKFMANYVRVESERRGVEDNPNGCLRSLRRPAPPTSPAPVRPSCSR
jgi:phosphate-selective porin OprO/OprP